MKIKNIEKFFKNTLSKYEILTKQGSMIITVI